LFVDSDIDIDSGEICGGLLDGNFVVVVVVVGSGCSTLQKV
jgi:hypothetical protein